MRLINMRDFKNIPLSIYLILFIVLWIISSNIIVGDNINEKENVENIKSAKIIENKIDYENLKQFLSEIKGSTVSWISRKEIAAWSATILYLSAILMLLNKLKLFRIKKELSIIFLTAFTLLILLFIHQQYGQMVDSMATERAINKYLYLINMEDSTVMDFNYNLEKSEVIPLSLADEIKTQGKIIRHVPFYKRIFLPTVKIYRGLVVKDNVSKTVEIQEAVLYNIILLAFFLMCIMIVCTHYKESKNENKSKKLLRRKKVINK